ncbi:helix-turn-helix domain-containing protein [Streptomyces sp. NPDC055189]
MGAVFRHVQQYTGASQSRIATAAGMTQARVNEIINRRREVTRLDVYERIADGLHMPDDARHLLGLAASREQKVGGAAFDLAAFPEVVRVYATQSSAAREIRRDPGAGGCRNGGGCARRARARLDRAERQPSPRLPRARTRPRPQGPSNPGRPA